MRTFEYPDDDESEDSGRVTLSVELRRETSGAWLVFDGAREAWIPKSQGELVPDTDGRTSTLVVPEWLAKEKGLI
jgi:hypothetical protein